MSVSRGLRLWRVARAAPRAVSLARIKCTVRRAPPLSAHSAALPSRRHLSSQANSDFPRPGSTSHSESESDPVSSTSDSNEAKMSSDPEVTSEDPDPAESPDPEVTSDLEDDRAEVLEAALQHVPALGWAPAALLEGARDVGLAHAAEDMFPRGGGELVDYFERQCNSHLFDYLKQRVEQENAKGPELLEEAVEHRLRMIIPYINNWPQAMALKAFPTNAPTALETLALMVDDTWYCAGDRSTDFSWYTKRGLLATIYSSTELFLVQDTSADFQETWKFLHRRMEDANTFGKASKEFQGLVSGGVETFLAGLNTALNVLGMKSR